MGCLERSENEKLVHYRNFAINRSILAFFLNLKILVEIE